MNIPFFIKGLLIALIIAIPLGPMAIICIRRYLREGFLSGFMTALGVTIGDTVFAIIAGFSMSFILDRIHQYEKIMAALGSMILFGFGVYVIRSKIKFSNSAPKHQTLFKYLVSSTMLTLSNPATLVALISLFSWIGATKGQSQKKIVMLVAGVSIGVLAWFTIVGILISIFKTKLNEDRVNKINKFMGIALVITAIGMLIKMIYS